MNKFISNYPTGILVKLNPSNWLCPNENAVFQCQSTNSSSMYWRLRSADNDFYYIHFNSGTVTDGTILTGHFGASTTSINIIAANSTSISSILTVFNGSLLNQTRIECNDDILYYYSYPDIGMIICECI